INAYRKQIRKQPIEIIGVLASKISTNNQFVKHTLPQRLEVIPNRYGLNVMDTIIYERDDLAKCSEKIQMVGNLEIADPMSVIDFKPESISAQEFESLAKEVLRKIGISS
ncbi:MAG: ParA family protein, partial [Rhizonema sp. PD38]|nr:ParA family protein [Rhizonema sp. PD38]